MRVEKIAHPQSRIAYVEVRSRIEVQEDLQYVASHMLFVSGDQFLVPSYNLTKM